jgi:hypothetical protein
MMYYDMNLRCPVCVDGHITLSIPAHDIAHKEPLANVQ